MNFLSNFERTSKLNLKYMKSSRTHYSKMSFKNRELFIQEEVKRIENWWSSPRFKDIKRIYTPLDVIKHRGSLGISDVKYPSSTQAIKLFNLLEENFKKKKPLHTLGVIDPVQMTQLSKCDDIKVAYVSGWACSSTMVGSTNEVSPDFGDYPYDTVPNQVERIFKAQKMHDRKSFLECIEKDKPLIDYMKPIIADADMGHGGVTTVMKLAKLFAEKGAAGIHLEDQLAGGKRCGHLGGAVLVPTSTHVSRLIATRLQWDIMGVENLIIARTDSCNSKLISSSCDPRDHEFIQGIIDINAQPWSEKLIDLERHNATSLEMSRSELEWYNTNKLVTFDEAVQLQVTSIQFERYIEIKKKLKFSEDKNYLSLGEMRKIIKQVCPEIEIKFDWDLPRSSEGYYMFKGCMNAAIRRSLIFTPFSDLIWLETKTPNIKQAKKFSNEIHEQYPNTKLVYNLSPSFDWSKHGFTDIKLKNFIWDLSKEGFILQLVSLAGLHVDGVSFWELAKNFQNDGMLSYVKLVQEKEKKINCDLLTHQRWSGAEYVDSIMKVVQNGSSKTLSTTGDSFTESQF
ncbi:similar to Saccharomyces cerevisiae YPR006C ICL2 methylisocitrate lyase of the mitochondrial matrix [Maudiozyma saulgeensis]|uniref:Isocitrate lyase n=1 Tax=Maudiozyma saulgeensis TaxID=1789683 RepID=A0A1X7R0X9_9SACH|nr:similar to Saccharomyces cerevisiae YPR006C ICL2 methylisocitrate lyase of the mitochondrial matrix [Kazachstania saulgeensis]